MRGKVRDLSFPFCPSRKFLALLLIACSLYAEWKNTKGPRTLTYSFKVLRKERVTKDIPTSELPFSKTEFRKELAATRLADLKGPGIVTGLPGIVPFGTKHNVTVGPGPSSDPARH
jgi:hypothetical protein